MDFIDRLPFMWLVIGPFLLPYCWFARRLIEQQRVFALAALVVSGATISGSLAIAYAGLGYTWGTLSILGKSAEVMIGTSVPYLAALLLQWAIHAKRISGPTSVVFGVLIGVLATPFADLIALDAASRQPSPTNDLQLL